MKKQLTLFFSLVMLGLCVELGSQTTISISEARQVDADGSLVNLGANVELQGIAIGPNFRPGGHTWVLFDTTNNIGITVFGFNNDAGYEVNDGDALSIVGELDEFNGLAEIIPESIQVLSTGNSIPEPETVTAFSELTEAKLIRLENVMLADPSQWGNGNFNVDLTDGSNTFQMRIDGDIDIAGMPAPQGSFNVIGVGGQFDNSAPYFSGYQIFPRSMSDIDPYDTGGSTGLEYERLTIEEAREIDLNGNAVRIGERVEVQGVTHGINIRPSGLQFTIINNNNRGINVFSSGNAFNYDYAEGDEIILKGVVDQFNGLTQINPDSIFLVSQGNDLVSPLAIAEMNESNEGSLVSMQMNGWIDESDWAGNGSSFNIEFQTVDGITQTIRIDSDTELATATIPSGNSFVTGIVGQFDNSEPYDEGYQLIPFRISDFDPYSSVLNADDSDFQLYPNPADNRISLQGSRRILSVEIFSTLGKRMQKFSSDFNSMNISGLSSGSYILLIESEDGLYSTRLFKN